MSRRGQAPDAEVAQQARSRPRRREPCSGNARPKSQRRDHGDATFSAVDDAHGTGERLVQVENAAISLADAVEDLVRDMETIVLNLPDTTKRTHEIGQVNRARKLARVVRAAVAEARRQTPGSMTT
jgi:hypothetical protein